MRLYALRHGETSWNVQRRFQGQSDIPLNDKGILLAELTGEGLADIPFDLAFTSPLCRARQTAELVRPGRDAESEPGGLHLPRGTLPSAGGRRIL